MAVWLLLFSVYGSVLIPKGLSDLLIHTHAKSVMFVEYYTTIVLN